jgi:hypothetical protein
MTSAMRMERVRKATVAALPLTVLIVPLLKLEWVKFIDRQLYYCCCC